MVSVGKRSLDGTQLASAFFAHKIYIARIQYRTYSHKMAERQVKRSLKTFASTKMTTYNATKWSTRNEDKEMEDLIVAFQNLSINSKRPHEYHNVIEGHDTEQGQLKRSRYEAANFTALPQKIKFSMGCTKETPRLGSANEPTCVNAVSSQWKYCLLKNTTINRLTYKRLKSTWRA